MADRVAFKRGKRNPWIKARSRGGHCFTMSFDHLEAWLRKDGCLDPDETVERFEIDDHGITVFFETDGSAGMKGSRYRLPKLGKFALPYEKE